MTGLSDRYDYLGRTRRQNIAEEMRERRRTAVMRIAKISVQVTDDGQSVRELLFDVPPTLAQLVARAGADAFVLAIGRQVSATDRRDRGDRTAAE